MQLKPCTHQDNSTTFLTLFEICLLVLWVGGVLPPHIRLTDRHTPNQFRGAVVGCEYLPELERASRKSFKLIVWINTPSGGKVVKRVFFSPPVN